MRLTRNADEGNGHFNMDSEEEIEVKREDHGLETKFEVDCCPMSPDEAIKPCRQCLICFHDYSDSDPRPLTGLLPKAIEELQNPETVRDDLRIIYLLKILFQWNASELTHLMEQSNGESPRDWIHICESCISPVLQIAKLEDEMSECRAKIKKKMMDSMKNASWTPTDPDTMTITRRIQNLVNENATSAAAFRFSDGDREAERLVNLRTQPEPENELHGAPDSDEFANEDTFPCHDEYEASSARPVKRSRKVGRKKKSMCSPSHPHPSPPDMAGMEECFTCPYCCSQNKAHVYSPSKKMNMVDLFYHLIYHYDYPMSCSECKTFLPRNSSELDAHWQQYHCDVVTTSQETPRFVDLMATEVEIQMDGEQFPPGKKQRCSIKCNNCVDGKFDSVTKFKLHQALRHPEVARWSCPLCLEKPKTKTVLDKHLKIVHEASFERLKRSYLCKFCGERLHDPRDNDDHGRKPWMKWKLKESLNKIQKLHMMSSHGDLINASYTCTQCSQECSHLKEFVDHANLENHPAINCNTAALQLCTFSGNSITCDLCDSGEEPAIVGTVKSFMCHLTLSHSLYLKWDYDPLKPSAREEVSWKSIEDHLKQMEASRRLADVIKRRSTAIQEKQASHSKWKAKYDKERPPRYSCPACPQLEEMNVDTFIVHLLYHWRHPNKCTSCNILLPFASEAVEDHWKQYHPETDSQIKSEPMHFTPGDIFGCQKCPNKFSSFRDRNEHEQSHGIGFKEKTNSCSVCDEHFVNLDEVRIHKALDHPEVACVSCFYCEDIFKADSVEGGQFLDSETLEQHILEMDDHPKDEAGMARHLYACEICGEVIADRFKHGKRVRAHISKVHGKEYLKTSFMCFICNKAVHFHLWKHVSGVHAKNCVCETCGEEMRPQSLPDHCLATHNILMEGCKQFCCEHVGCGYKTVQSCLLKFHLNTHHNKERQRTHKCSFCEKAFVCSKALSEHEERHTNKETKPYQCEICGSSFAVRNYLYIHKRLSHLNQKFPSTNRKRSKKGK